MASVSGGERKLKPASCKDSHPELSLSWCLAHLSKPKHQKPDGGSAKRSPMAQWRALVAIRTHHIKGHRSSISRFRRQGGLEPLLGLIRQTDCSRKTLDLALSILGNCCTERETCSEVRKLDGINVVVEAMKNHVALLSIQNRAARVLGNLAMYPENSALVHSAGGAPLLLLCVTSASSPSSSSTSPSSSSPGSPPPCPAPPPPVESSPALDCAQSAARALFYLSDTPCHRVSLVSQGAVAALCPLAAPELPVALRRASLRALHELTRGCGVDCARQVVRCGALAQLGLALEPGEEEGGGALEELALKTLANLCAQGCLRPLVGSLGAVRRFVEEVKRDALKSGLFLKALCLCCKEAVNRAKVKECGGLELLIGFLAAHQSHPLSRFVIQACVDFVFDEAAVEQFLELGLVPLLVERLVQLSKGEEPVSAAGSNPPLPDVLPQGGLDSYDFPAPEEKREQALCSSSFLSLRSWLLSEGLISSEGDLLESDLSGLPLSSPHTPPTTSHPRPFLSPVTSSTPLNPPPAPPPTSPSSTPINPPPAHPPSSPSSTPLNPPPAPPPSSTPISPPPAPPPSSTPLNPPPAPPPSSTPLKPPPAPPPSSPSSTPLNPPPAPPPSSTPLKPPPAPPPSSPSSTPLNPPPAPPPSSTPINPPPAPPPSSPSSTPINPPPAPPPSSPSTPLNPHPAPPPSSPSSSPTKFRLSSPLRRRPRDKPCVPRLPLETPPSVTRPPSYHPYHPEPWTPESPVLLLLSRFSHVSDPSAALANCAAVSGLLLYLTRRGDPSGRCFRMLLRLSNNPNCLQALVRSGAAALIHYRLCDRGEEGEEGEEEGGQQSGQQSARVKARVRQLGLSLLTNLQLQCESGFGAGVLTHIMLSGTESDRLHCALSLPLLTSNKTLLRKLLLDGGGLQFALQPLGGDTDSAQTQTPDLPLRSLYCPLLVGCLSALTALAKPSDRSHFGVTDALNERVQPPPGKKPRLDPPSCPYDDATFDLAFLLDDGAEIPANRGAVSGEEASSGSEYFRALLRGGFGEALGEDDAIPIGDVSAAMLTPVLHHLHGCRVANGDATATARGRCRVLQAVVNARPSGNDDFEKTAMGEAMVGACRFLVCGLQNELEEVFVSLLDSGDVLEKEENAAQRPDSGNGSHAAVLDLLPEIYWFSQRYSYRRLSASCLSLLTRRRFSQTTAGQCLSRLAREADSGDALRKDLVALAADALS